MSTANLPIEITDKSQWGNLIGRNGNEVSALLKQAHPDLNFIIVEDGMAVTMDYRLDRVRLFVDKEGRISSPPHIG